MSDMKERILLAALSLFSVDGYEAASVSDIASRLGITKGALYKHYKNKQDILDSIILRMKQDDEQQATFCDLPTGTLSESEESYKAASVEKIIQFGKAQFEYWTTNDYAGDFRKMLTIEQHRSKEMNSLFQQYLGTGPLGYVSDLFSSIGIKEYKELALELYAPMFFLYSVYDGAENKEYPKKLAAAHFERVAERIFNAAKKLK